MYREDARAGRRVQIVYLEQAFHPTGVDPGQIDARRPSGIGTLIAPVAGHDGLLWYVRYSVFNSGRQVAVHSVDELELVSRSPTFRTWSRTPDQEAVWAQVDAEVQQQSIRELEEDRRREEAEQQAQADQQAEADIADEISALEDRIERGRSRIEEWQQELAVVRARLAALRAGRRRSLPVPPPPPAPKLPDEPQERFLDI